MGIQRKACETMYKNGTVPTSKQQIYLYELFGIDLNMPIDIFHADILLEDNIICEYDGGGHRLKVFSGRISSEQFNKRQEERDKIIKEHGYKIIRIISRKDHIPSDEIILDIINRAKDYLKSSHSWFEIDIDNSYIRCSEYTKKHNFGKVRSLSNKDFSKYLKEEKR
jgi:very-short-patch-repair endonuclease